MEKTKQTSLNIEIDILNFCKENKIVLSQWVNKKFSDEFFGLNSKIKRLEEIKQEEYKLKKQIELIKSRTQDINSNLTTREIRFLQSVELKRKQGFEMKAMHNLFTNDYRNISFDDFISLAKKYEEINDERTKYRMNKKR
jgi:hypothetical protein